MSLLDIARLGVRDVEIEIYGQKLRVKELLHRSPEREIEARKAFIDVVRSLGESFEKYDRESAGDGSKDGKDQGFDMDGFRVQYEAWKKQAEAPSMREQVCSDFCERVLGIWIWDEGKSDWLKEEVPGAKQLPLSGIPTSFLSKLLDMLDKEPYVPEKKG